MMNLPSEVNICEVGLRDGLQNEKTIVSTQDKLDILRDLIDAVFNLTEENLEKGVRYEIYQG